jgi:hypothetical protein
MEEPMESKRNCKLLSHSILAPATVIALFVSAYPAVAKTYGQGFASPQEAARALVKAAKSGNTNAALHILGPSAKEVLSTNDPVADQRARTAFVQKAEERMVIIPDPDRAGQKMMQIGNAKWPFPIPIVRVGGRWRFDVEQGKQEILVRRIGRNELTAIDVSRGYVEAQNEYFEKDRDGNGQAYAQKFISSAGQKDGLYWKSTDPDDASPIAEFVGKAMEEGYVKRGEPYHGYFFKILKAQGPKAPGGEMSYIDDDGNMTRGFALIAWPAGYKSTGVMTFLVGKAGIVYQKNLGARTAEMAGAMDTFNPDQSWTPVAGSGVPKTTTNLRHSTRASR